MSKKGDPCNVCLVPLTRDNSTGICKRNPVCSAAYVTAYNKVHEEEHAAYWRDHKVEKAVYDAAYREEHKEALAIKAAAYYAENPDRAAAYYQEHKEEQAVYHAAWNRANPERVSAYGARRRAKVMVNMDRLDRDLSVEYRKAIAHDLCFYCKRSEEHTSELQS